MGCAASDGNGDVYKPQTVPAMPSGIPPSRCVVVERPIAKPAEVPIKRHRRALLIGINYPGTDAELNGCTHDVDNVQQLLSEWHGADLDGWVGRRVRRLINGDATRARILDGLDWLVAGCRKGDVLFLQYSGHGAQAIHPDGLSEDGMTAALLPADFGSKGPVLGIDLHERLVRFLPEGVKLTVLFDACHSGTALNLPWKLQARSGKGGAFGKSSSWQEETNPLFVRSDVALLSSCAPDQLSCDGVASHYGRPGASLTKAFCKVMRRHFGTATLSYAGLLAELQSAMVRKGFRQVPQLSSSQAFEAERRAFSLGPTDEDNAGSERGRSVGTVMLNRNPKLVQRIRMRFAPHPAAYDKDEPLCRMLRAAGLLVTSEMAAKAQESLIARFGESAVIACRVPYEGDDDDASDSDTRASGDDGIHAVEDTSGSSWDNGVVDADDPGDDGACDSKIQTAG